MIHRSALAILLTMLFSLQSYARDYSVEAIIFTHSVAANTPVEQWDDKAPRNIKAKNKLNRFYQQAVEATRAREKATQNEKAGAATATVAHDSGDLPETKQTIETVISPGLMELQNIANTLEQSPDHEILQTLSWNQSEANYKDSPLINTLNSHMKGVIRVYAPNLLFAEINLTYVPDEILPESLLNNVGGGVNEPGVVPEPAFEASYASINYASDYQHEPVIVHYFMDEQRKLKLNEIHYFDHPRFGVILSVKPIEAPAPKSS